jgi:hypothetical protein
MPLIEQRASLVSSPAQFKGWDDSLSQELNSNSQTHSCYGSGVKEDHRTGVMEIH